NNQESNRLHYKMHSSPIMNEGDFCFLDLRIDLDNEHEYKRASAIIVADVYNWLMENRAISEYSLEEAVNNMHVLPKELEKVIDEDCGSATGCVYQGKGRTSAVIFEEEHSPDYPVAYPLIHEAIHLIPVQTPNEKEYEIPMMLEDKRGVLHIEEIHSASYFGVWVSDQDSENGAEVLMVWAEPFTDVTALEYAMERTEKEGMQSIMMPEMLASQTNLLQSYLYGQGISMKDLVGPLSRNDPIEFFEIVGKGDPERGLRELTGFLSFLVID
ncbi:hypothetical protein JXC34_02325, partial [Candidatus Woesearchaeota archaeon]|nr:hypothetical protein [Candidatus Woesearchaeota archaeon]